jgi:hypothetical protein
MRMYDLRTLRTRTYSKHRVFFRGQKPQELAHRRTKPNSLALSCRQRPNACQP